MEITKKETKQQKQKKTRKYREQTHSCQRWGVNEIGEGELRHANFRLQNKCHGDKKYGVGNTSSQ